MAGQLTPAQCVVVMNSVGHTGIIFMEASMESIIKHHRVELRVQGNQNILNPKLVEYNDGVAVKYETAGIGFQKGGTYQHFKPVFSWAYEDKKHFWSDRPNMFTLPGGVFRVFDINKDGGLQERK